MRGAALRTIAVAYAAYLGIALAPNVLLDDAAITFRYADRLAAGDGFTYNDHEHVLGASNPLYTLLLALLHLIGVDLETAARAVGLTCFVLAVLLAFDLAERLSNPLGGLVAGLALASEPHFRAMSLAGLESGLAVVLGLLVVAALMRGRDGWAGVFLGLAIWNKLDAGLLAVAVAGAILIVRRQFPVRIAVTAALVALPWALFSLAYYGSILPQPLEAKVQHQRGAGQFDELWVVKFLAHDRRWVWVVVALAALLVARRRPPREAVVILSLAGWFALHALAYSVLDLGDDYPWYHTVLLPPLIVLAVASVAGLLTSARSTTRRAIAVAGMVAIVLSLEPGVRIVRAEIDAGNPVTGFEAFDTDRRLAGAFVDRYADRNEVVWIAFGWPAYEVDNPVNDGTRLNSKEMLEPASYFIVSGSPYDSGSNPPRSPPGLVPLATFNLASDLMPGYSWFTVFGRPDSRIAESGRRYLQMRLFELPPQRDYSRVLRARGVTVSGLDLVAPPGSGATFTVPNARRPVHVVFTPAARGGPTRWELRADRRLLRGGDGRPERRLIVEVPGARARERVDLSFLSDGAMAWQGVKVVVGDPPVDVESVAGEKLARLWSAHNPG